MKIAVYSIETVTPKDENEYEDFCDILNAPTLKYGAVSFVGKFLYYITKSDLKKRKTYYARYYDRTHNVWREGVRDRNDGSFIEYASK